MGYPSLSQTERLILAFERIGVDIVELGFPFSDPLADGPTIQRASDFALRHHIQLDDAFRLVKKLRKKNCQIPIVLFSYYNPVFHRGIEPVAKSLKQSGFQGIVIPDLPPDESAQPAKVFRDHNLLQIYLIAPTTDPKRMAWIASRSQGFIYYVSLRGVTGARKALDPELSKQVRALKQKTKKPVLVGFGVSSESHVKQICKFADGVIVGSAIVQSLSNRRFGFQKTVRFVRSLVQAAKPLS